MLMPRNQAGMTLNDQPPHQSPGQPSSQSQESQAEHLPPPSANAASSNRSLATSFLKTGELSQSSPGHFKDHYVIQKAIGKGTYAHVFKCAHVKTGEIYAVKVVDKSKAGPKDIADANHEIFIMARIGFHKNVVRMVEYFVTQAHLYIVMDLLDGGMLFDRIVKLKHYSEKSAVEVVRHVLEALAHIHSTGVIHRDLKPENLLLPHPPEDELSEVTDVCIADFGLATIGPSTVCCGSPSYIAPEVILRGYFKSTNEPYNEKCDIWSVGIITYALLSGRLPFSSSSHQKIFALVVEGKWAFTGSAWANVSSLACDFVKKCLEPNPHVRASAKELLQHPWVATLELPDVHLGDAQKRLRELCEKRVRAAVRVFALARCLLDMSNDERPPFMRYIRHKNALSTQLTHQSQTDTTKEHTVDFGIPMQRRRSPTFRMQDCCTCTSASVCRHIQNVHEYLFVGKRSMDVPPLFEVLKNLGLELEYRWLNGTPSNDVKVRLIRVLYVIEAACVFSKCLSEVPVEQLKPNFMVSPARLSQRDANIAIEAGRQRRALEAQPERPETVQRILSNAVPPGHNYMGSARKVSGGNATAVNRLSSASATGTGTGLPLMENSVQGGTSSSRGLGGGHGDRVHSFNPPVGSGGSGGLGPSTRKGKAGCAVE